MKWKEFLDRFEEQPLEIDVPFLECAIDIESYEEAVERMTTVAQARLRNFSQAQDQNTYVFPTGLFFARGDRQGPGRSLINEISSSFDYWDIETDVYFDVIYPGWKKTEGKLTFDLRSFSMIKDVLETQSKWVYGGETELLLLNFLFRPLGGVGGFAFKEAVVLPVENMIRKGVATSVSALMNDAIRAAKRSTSNGGVWEISDKLGYQRLRKSI